MNRAVSLKLLAAVCMAGISLGQPAWALYKVVGPDGRVTYTDRAPTDTPAVAMKTNGATASTEGLPYELQKVMERFPVTLYTSKGCAPCDSGRDLLKTRGIPYVEKTVNTPEDVAAFRKQEGTEQLPVIRIGQKQMLGLTLSEWTSYLDAAGYPAKSILPVNYRIPAASPMAPAVTKAPASSAPSPSVGSTPSVTPSGNAGIRF
jgi:glutaredoxin